MHAFEANTPFEKLPGTQINVPRLNLHQRPRHRRRTTHRRDFVPWRFLDAGRRSAWIASLCRHPKTCTIPDVRTTSRRRTLIRLIGTSARGLIRASLSRRPTPCSKHSPRMWIGRHVDVRQMPLPMADTNAVQPNRWRDDAVRAQYAAIFHQRMIVVLSYCRCPTDAG